MLDNSAPVVMSSLFGPPIFDVPLPCATGEGEGEGGIGEKKKTQMVINIVRQ